MERGKFILIFTALTSTLYKPEPMSFAPGSPWAPAIRRRNRAPRGHNGEARGRGGGRPS